MRIWRRNSKKSKLNSRKYNDNGQASKKEDKSKKNRNYGYINWKMAYKINSLVILIALFMSLVGYIGYYYYKKEDTAMNNMYSVYLRSVQLLDTTTADTKASEASVIQLILAPVDAFTNQRMESDIKTQEALVDRALVQFAPLVVDSYETERLPKLKDALLHYRAEYQKAIDIAQAGDRQGAYDYYSNNAQPYLDIINIILPELVDHSASQAESINRQNSHDFRNISLVLFILPIVAVLAAVVIGYIVARKIANPLKEMLANVKQVANGNLLVEDMKIKSRDEVGQLALAFNQMTDSLRSLVSKVAQSAKLVAESSEELSAVAEEGSIASGQIGTTVSNVAINTQNQAATVSETSKAMTQISASYQQFVETSHNVANLTDKTVQAAQNGQEAVNKSVIQMDSIKQGTDGVEKAIGKLAASSRQIGKIIMVISDIAEQTNLLALNAAIEAARAGAQGRGFAVVADEVRKLAEKSKQAAKQITSLIQENQENINASVSAIQTGKNDVNRGTEVVRSAGNEFSEITRLIEDVRAQVGEALLTIEQIAGGSEQLLSSVQEVDSTSLEVANEIQNISVTVNEQSASMGEITAACQNLSSMAQELQNAISRFKV